MIRNGWQYYNNSLMSALPPHMIPEVAKLDEKEFWKGWGGFPLFASWCTDFDCNEETEWWYVIKDSLFEISKLSSKRRYEITKGNRNFETREIQASDYCDDIYKVTIEAYGEWPAKYRPHLDRPQFDGIIKEWDSLVVIGGFDRESGNLCGYALLKEDESLVSFNVLRVLPRCERQGINAAIVFSIIDKYNKRLSSDFYICDGSRNIRHETSFQDYLEKYFGFRKAYCRLHIKYRLGMHFIIGLIYHFRKIILGKSRLGSLTKALLKLEDISRQCKKESK